MSIGTTFDSEARSPGDPQKEEKALKAVAGALFILASLALTVAFMLLRKHFGYPEMIRKGPEAVLPRLHEMARLVPYLFYAGVGVAGLCVFFAARRLARVG